jgi:cyclopropane-fatty-acyl-phospholipid synthase
MSLSSLLRHMGRPPLRIVLWDGEEIYGSDDPPIASIRIHDRRTLWKLLCNPEVQFGDGYSAGRIEVEGDLVALIESLFKATGQSTRHNPRAALLPDWYRSLSSFVLGKLQRNSIRGSRKNIHYHYDLGNDFYKLWLDSQLVYTCAYFPTPADSLEQAQIAKMDHVCRKLQLQPGETVVEAGCGWGALALHMARYYGVSVKAFNISREQISYARQRAREENLSGKVEFIEDDYRNLSGRFDVFASVGMLEHVGREHYEELGNVMDRCLGDSGRGFLHFIGRDSELPLNAWARKRIFPGAYPPTLGQVMKIFEPRNLSVLDVENLRLHYAKTLEHWLERFERSADLVEYMFDRDFVRAWRLYLAGSVAGFRTGWLQLFQVTFARSACNEIAWTRAHLYQTTERELSVNSSVMHHQSRS